MIELPTSIDAPVLLHGDCLDMLARLPDASIHVVVTDPPAEAAAEANAAAREGSQLALL